MNGLLVGLKKILSPIVDFLHIRGAASTVYQYLLDNLFMFWVILAFTLLLFVAFILIIVLSVKAHKRKKAIRKAKKQAKNKSSNIQNTVKEAADTEKNVAEEVATESAEEVVEEVTTENTEEVAEEVTTESAEEIAEEVTTESTEEVAEEIASAQEIPPQTVAAEKAEPVIEKPVTKKQSAPATRSAKESAAEKKQTKYRGKWVISKLSVQQENGDVKEVMYFFELRASNGEKLMESQEYTTLSGAKKGIETHVSNIKGGNFKVSLTKKGTYIFKLMNAKGMLLCTGENYISRARCESAIESTKRFAETAVIDSEVQEIVVKTSADDENSAITPAAEGAVGKWVISKQVDDMGGVSYYFELYANNGEKLLSSEDYTSQSGALSGLETHKKNIEKGNFRILPTKRGDYIFKLLNGLNQLLCLGEHYKTRRLCQNAVESVKRFALNSPIVNDEE